ncbi:MAG: hypothetical protein FJZ64_03730, partial [Chlamydiae bacterium]|nr:hypothetical protein [Chlamydiota bacterium]
MMKKSRKIPSDVLTPIAAFSLLREKGSALLETADRFDGSRFSLLGITPAAIFQTSGNKLVLEIDGNVQEEFGDPFQRLSDLEKRFSLPAIGFVSYDAVRVIEKIPNSHPPLGIPDFFFRFYCSMLLFDHKTESVTIFAETDQEIEALMKKLEGKPTLPQILKEPIEIKVDIPDEEFCEKVRIAKKYLIAGDCFQIVLSRTFQAKTDVEPFQIYRLLRQKSPAPYSFFLEGDGFSLAGASPEKLISVQDGIIESMPIAGTRTLDRPQEELLQDPKENAEHVMLVDLARNDLGRVCLPGEV